jgi:hypothetical protein
MLDLPLEYALIGFDEPKFSGGIVPELLRLSNSGIVRFVDIIVLVKDADGSAHALELNDLEPELYRAFVPFGEHVSRLFNQEDLEKAATWMPANTAALLLLWENLWTAGLRDAIKDAGGILLDRAQIQPEVVEEFKKAMSGE